MITEIKQLHYLPPTGDFPVVELNVVFDMVLVELLSVVLVVVGIVVVVDLVLVVVDIVVVSGRTGVVFVVVVDVVIVVLVTVVYTSTKIR